MWEGNFTLRKAESYTQEKARVVQQNHLLYMLIKENSVPTAPLFSARTLCYHLPRENRGESGALMASLGQSES